MPWTLPLRSVLLGTGHVRRAVLCRGDVWLGFELAHQTVPRSCRMAVVRRGMWMLRSPASGGG